MTQHSVTGKVSLYSFADNDVNGDFGTNKTASGIDTNSSLPTAAVQMNGRDGFKLGDVLLVQKGDRQVIVLATDVGGLPHAQVDIFDGEAARYLNMELDRNENGTFVKAADGSNQPELTQGYTITRIGHFPNLRGQHDNHQPNERSAAVLNTIRAINNGQQPASALLALQQQGILESVSLPEGTQQPQVAQQGNMFQANPVSTQPEAPASPPQQDNGILGWIMGIIGTLISMFRGESQPQSQPTQPQTPVAPPVTSTQQPQVVPQAQTDIAPPLATPLVQTHMVSQRSQ